MSSVSHPTVKIVFTPPFGQSMAEETRRVPSSSLLPNQPLFNQLVAYLTQTYSSKYGADAQYLISYDDGEDMCVITSEEEIKEAIHVQGGKSLKLMVTIEEKANLNTPLLSATPLVYHLSGASTPAVHLNHSISSSNCSISSATEHHLATSSQSMHSAVSLNDSNQHSLNNSFQQLLADDDADDEPSVSTQLAPPSGVFPARTDSQDSAVVLSDTDSDDDGGYVRIEEDVENQTEMSSQAGIKMIETHTSTKSQQTQVITTSAAAPAPTAAANLESAAPAPVAPANSAPASAVITEEEISIESISTQVDQISLSSSSENQAEEVVIISPDASLILPEKPIDDIQQYSIGIQSDTVYSEAIATQTESHHTQVDSQTQTTHDEVKTAVTSTRYEVDRAYPASTLNPPTVFQDYDVLLYHIESSHPTYYRMQLINDIGITLWTRSGFTVEGGSTCSRVFGQNSIEAIDTFKELFFNKTGIKWEQRNQFVEPVEGKYRVVAAVAPVLTTSTVTSTLPTHPIVTSAPTMDEFVHERITCDICHTSPIIGIRYKCTVCRDFDLCGKCETENKHPSNHILMKIRSPLTTRQSHALDAELASKNGQISINSCAPFVSCIGPKQHRPKAEFIHDVTLADGSRVIAGEQINKVFRVKNIGKEAWPAGTRLIFTGGDLIQSDSQSPQSQSANSVIVPYAGVNEIVNISIDIVVPEIDGDEERMRATFRLVTADGTKFGPRIWIDIIAVNPSYKPVAEKSAPADPEERKASSAPAVTIPVAIPVREIVAQTKAIMTREELWRQEKAKAEEQTKAELLKAEQARAEEQLKAEQARAEEQLKAEQLKAAASSVEDQKEEKTQVASRSFATTSASAASSLKDGIAKISGLPELNFKYRNELASLRSMGFTGTELNKYLLNQHGGNVAKCVDWILNNSK